MIEITFQTIYHTTWGQQMVIVGNIPQLGSNEISHALRMQYVADGLWSGSIQMDSNVINLHYRYVLVDELGVVIDEEWGSIRRFPDVADLPKSIMLLDGWRSKFHPEHAFHNSAFLDVLFKPVYYASSMDQGSGKEFHFEICVPRTFGRLQVCLLGNIPELGLWDFDQPLLLDNESYPIWKGSIKQTGQAMFYYKYGLYDPALKRVLYLEEGPNRQFSNELPQDLVMIRDQYFRHRNPLWKGSGVSLPVFSLRTERSFGVGGFSDLFPLIDWAKKTGMRLVQILPINDTSATNTWVDSYPYSSISVFALHPQYLDLALVEGFNASVDQDEYQLNLQRLNALPVIDYEAVIKWKLYYARAIFQTQKNKFQERKDFKSFFSANQHWLKSYALFCVFRDFYGTSDFNQWHEHSVYFHELMSKFTEPKTPHHEEILFYYFLQFHLDQQLASVAAYARSEGIVLKGDIAIGIYRESADAWTSPDLFDMRSQAGAPPDPFSELGQNWGFPTYRWDVMARDNYAWWQNRLRNFSRYFDAFRIDHILGFFRIWQIPYNQVQGLLGYFNPALPVTLSEFSLRRIPFSKERYCQPYITEEILRELFRDDAESIKRIFLAQQVDGLYHFKDEFDTQRKVYDWLRINTQWTSWRDRLFQLHAEVLFIPDNTVDVEIYHPRIDFQKTASFKSLDVGTQAALQDLYIDYFYRRQEDFWKTQGMTKLPAIKNATKMLICGEDLGMIPACVPKVMRELDLLTLEIQRMSKNPDTEFLQEEDIPYLSVCSTSTHDMSPIRAWWLESEKGYIERFYRNELKQQGLPPKDCNRQVAEMIITRHLEWPGMWAIFPIQDLLAMSDRLKRMDPMAERINIPANPNHYWQYRLHLTLEELLRADDFNNEIRDLLQKSGRNEDA